MIPIRRDYSYQWGRENDISELTGALAMRMKSSNERILKEGIDVERISLSLLRIYRDWWPYHKSDLDLQALLAVAAACEWLWQSDQERLQDLLEMLDEVAEAHYIEHYNTNSNTNNGEAYDQLNEFTPSGLRLAVARALGATVQTVALQPDYIEISFTDGNYGDGLFSGCVCLDYTAAYGPLYILNNTRLERQDFQGTDLPRTDAEVEESLASDLWKPSRSREMLRPSEIRTASVASVALAQKQEQQQQGPSPITKNERSTTPSILSSSRLPSEEMQRQSVTPHGNFTAEESGLLGGRIRYPPPSMMHHRALLSQYNSQHNEYYDDDDADDDSQFINDSVCYTRGSGRRQPTPQGEAPPPTEGGQRSVIRQLAVDSNGAPYNQQRLPVADQAIESVGFRRRPIADIEGDDNELLRREAGMRRPVEFLMGRDGRMMEAPPVTTMQPGGRSLDVAMRASRTLDNEQQQHQQQMITSGGGGRSQPPQQMPQYPRSRTSSNQQQQSSKPLLETSIPANQIDDLWSKFRPPRQ